MKPFLKSEIFAVLVIFLVLIGISTPNFVVSLRRARDQVRRNDIGSLEHALDAYRTDFSTFPESSPDGKIIACKAPGDKVEVDKGGRINVKLVPCEWGRDAFVDLTPGSNKVYMQKLPSDPHANSGTAYVYFSDGVRFQVLTSLEGIEEDEYNESIAARKVMCGNKICNMGKSFDCPLDKSIEEYKAYLQKLREMEDAQK